MRQFVNDTVSCFLFFIFVFVSVLDIIASIIASITKQRVKTTTCVRRVVGAAIETHRPVVLTQGRVVRDVHTSVVQGAHAEDAQRKCQ